MKNLLFFLALAVMLAVGCGKDDDNGGSGGQDGDLTIRLTWDQADADLDLDLTGPGTILLGSGGSTLTGATHSGDDLSGPGEEVIMFDNVAPDGDYTVFVEWFNGAGDVSYTIEFESAGTTRTFNETIDANVDTDTYTFTKNGRTLDF